MVILLPRLPGPAADALIERFLANGPNDWTGFDPDDLPEAVRFAATGGSRAGRGDLLKLRSAILETASANGFGTDNSRASYASFDAEIGPLLADMPLLASGEALRGDFWTFVGVSLAPDVVHWRFREARQRYLGGIRNTFQRTWLRARALDRGEQHPERWQLLEELTEDALVQITERPSIGADTVLARAVAEAWLRARTHYGQMAMESVMRRATLRVRIWNEIRGLAELPAATLARVLDSAFDLPVAGQPGGASPPRRATVRIAGTNTSPVPGRGNPQRGRIPVPDAQGALSGDADPGFRDAARRILAEARTRHWISPKSGAALTALQGGNSDLGRRERNALAYLLERMRRAGTMQADATLLQRTIWMNEQGNGPGYGDQ